MGDIFFPRLEEPVSQPAILYAEGVQKSVEVEKLEVARQKVSE